MAMAYYRWFPGDYLRDTRHLSMLQHGAYRLLIDEYMVHGPLPNDLQRLYRIAQAFNAEERLAVEYVLTEFFLQVGPHWTHKRCEQEREYLVDKSKQAKQSATYRWCERIANAYPNAYPNAQRTHSERISERNANQNQNHIKPKPPPPPLTKQNNPQAVDNSVPDWLPAATWSDYVEHRKKKRAPMTPRAKELILAKLDSMRKEGHDPQMILEASIANGWTGVFATAPGKAIPGFEWVRSESGIAEMAKRHGLKARPGEARDEFVGRIHQAIQENKNKVAQ